LAKHGESAVVARYQIRCISRTALMNHDRRIAGIGGVNPDGAHWSITVEEAIAAIEAGKWSFYIDRGGRQLPVVIAVSKYGSKYIKTTTDTLQPDSLLALPECG
jgi:hypothetical protein